MSDNMNKNAKKDPSENSKMGLAIALGAGLGLVFGQFVFDSALFTNNL